MRTRRLRKHPAALEVTAFINLIVVLIPFLLSTAVFSRMAVMELTLPAQSTSFGGLKANDLKLEVVIRHDAVDVTDQIGGLIQHIPNTANGFDTVTLNTVMFQLKKQFPEKNDATVLAEPNTPYDVLVQVMDAVRSGRSAQGGTKVVSVDLFPAISIGDAPVSKR
jgi:biopolymer transport protein ExbD